MGKRSSSAAISQRISPSQLNGTGPRRTRFGRGAVGLYHFGASGGDEAEGDRRGLLQVEGVHQLKDPVRAQHHGRALDRARAGAGGPGVGQVHAHQVPVGLGLKVRGADVRAEGGLRGVFPRGCQLGNAVDQRQGGALRRLHQDRLAVGKKRKASGVGPVAAGVQRAGHAAEAGQHQPVAGRGGVLELRGPVHLGGQHTGAGEVQHAPRHRGGGHAVLMVQRRPQGGQRLVAAGQAHAKQRLPGKGGLHAARGGIDEAIAVDPGNQQRVQPVRGGVDLGQVQLPAGQLAQQHAQVGDRRGLGQLIRQRDDALIPGLHGLVDQPQRLLHHRGPAPGIRFQQDRCEQQVAEYAQRAVRQRARRTYEAHEGIVGMGEEGGEDPPAGLVLQLRGYPDAQALAHGALDPCQQHQRLGALKVDAGVLVVVEGRSLWVFSPAGFLHDHADQVDDALQPMLVRLHCHQRLQRLAPPLLQAQVGLGVGKPLGKVHGGQVAAHGQVRARMGPLPGRTGGQRRGQRLRPGHAAEYVVAAEKHDITVRNVTGHGFGRGA